MNDNVKTMWLQALRSGDYTQGREVLRSLDDTFCCLGVLCDTAVKCGVIPAPEWSPDGTANVDGWRYGDDEDDSTTGLPDAVTRWAGLTGPDPVIPPSGCGSTTLVELNDFEAYSFGMIADVIEEYL